MPLGVEGRFAVTGNSHSVAVWNGARDPAAIPIALRNLNDDARTMTCIAIVAMLAYADKRNNSGTLPAIGDNACRQ